ncbi:MAG: hypothetical protein DWQ47_10150 [Acidobacteria bacterium]|nr:MAG: hypothetical protein DWQ32_12565 [Acidobacteriota bacterium]REJ97952.1 MAG: hypothetical protein DWQ38_15365 [Acidobacteriota bacterium]REK16695.1 MAG: hypothetical protein DWQ43_00410 [Acidobacteriota bacterium]REK42606.1 MAG: hypothetical protein DWQ47_10150 [Acidobacteriota bacterium]
MSLRVKEIGELAGLPSHKASQNGSNAAFLAGIPGLDASGKGWAADRLMEILTGEGIRVGRLTADHWLSLPEVRFSDTDPGGNFYRNGLRLSEMFEGTVLPLKRERKIESWIDVLGLEETLDAFERIYFPAQMVHFTEDDPVSFADLIFEYG